LAWRTASETNSYQWLIERSVGSDQNYALLARIPAAGTTSEPANYRWADRSVHPGQIYSYRIGELNTAGQLTYYSPIQARAGLPAVNCLNGVLPNPFRDAVHIAYTVGANTQQVNFSIYNIAGQRVKTLVKGPQVSGRHLASWDGRNDGGGAAANGCYFLRWSIGREAGMLKLLRIR
ncbi:MAG: FlgD immunoglobulin-like domain containing protein, partial [bacterium]|nr:FlgD immunoglobulin-like domain containing protein [bacterium]